MFTKRFLPWLARAGLVLVLLLAALPGVPAAANASAAPLPSLPASILSKIDPQVLAQTANGGQADFLVVLVEQAALSGAAARPTKREKGRDVFHGLLATTQRTQRPLVA